MKKSKPQPRRWRIIRARAKGSYVGEVEAPDVESALDRAIEEFGIDPAQRWRLIAQPIE